MQDVLDSFHPLVAGWFRERFGAPTDPQREGWPRIAAGEDVLIAAPTGSGKTLAAFLACMDELVRRGLEQPLGDHTAILYVSPLKALSNDVQRNLEAPLAELKAFAAARGVTLPEVRVAVRTGDTPASERAKMAKRPPHILVTTPESLYILLTTDKGRAALGQLRTVIVDEIHAVAGDKRGAHLALSLERLDRLVMQCVGRTLDEPARVDEHDRRAMLLDQRGDPIVDALELLERRDRAELVVGDLDREIDRTAVSRIDDVRQRPPRADEQPRDQLDGPLGRRQADAHRRAAHTLHDQPIEALEREREVRVAVRTGDTPASERAKMAKRPRTPSARRAAPRGCAARRSTAP